MERLQKVLAQAGIASRRAAEQIILSGRVRVDGKIVTELGTQVDPRRSRVEVDGNKIVAEKLVYIVLHKPRGVVCTLSDPEGRPTILELIKGAGTRLVPVGRLDFHTSGALLCTNDGEFAQGLAHPKKAVPKVYVAKVKGTVDDDALEHFGDRIEIDGRPTQPAQVKRLRFEGDKTWLEITLSEGRNRQVRRLGEATGFPVMRLARLSHAGVDCESLRPGQWRELTLDEMIALKRDYGVPKKIHAPSIDYKKGIQERGEGPAARFDKRTPRTAPKKGASAPEVQGEHWRRESSRDERFGRDRESTRDAAPRGRDAAPRGRDAAPRGRDAAPRGRDNTRDAAPRGKRSDGIRRDRTPAAPEPRAPNRKAPFRPDPPREAGASNRKAPFQRESVRSTTRDPRAAGHKDREPAWAKGEKPRPRPGNKTTAKPGARESSRRPGTSR
jgi:23S rRNA pseudouridine2605 synthase